MRTWKQKTFIKNHSLQCWWIQWLIYLDTRKFKKKYPNYCRSCNGWGAWSANNYSYWEPPDVECCPNCVEQGKCPHCGVEAIDEDFEKCLECDWNFQDGDQDGLPVLDDCGCWNFDPKQEEIW